MCFPPSWVLSSACTPVGVSLLEEETWKRADPAEVVLDQSSVI